MKPSSSLESPSNNNATEHLQNINSLSDSASLQLTEQTKLRLEQNRQKALDIQQRRRQQQQYETEQNEMSPISEYEPNTIRKENETAVAVELRCLQSLPNVISAEEEDLDIHVNISQATLKICNSELHTESELLLYKSFNEKCCKSCQSRLWPEFETICRATALAEYLLPDPTIKLMKCYEKTNPKNTSWRPMNMYLRKHCRMKAIERFGSMEAVEMEKRKRGEVKLKKDLGTVSTVFSQSHQSLFSSSSSSSSQTSNKHDRLDQEGVIDEGLLPQNPQPTTKKKKTSSSAKNTFKDLAGKILAMRNK